MPRAALAPCLIFGMIGLATLTAACTSFAADHQAEHPDCKPEFLVTARLHVRTAGSTRELCAPRLINCIHDWSWMRSGHSPSPHLFVRVLGLTKYGYVLAIREDLVVEEIRPVVQRVTGPIHTRMVTSEKSASVELPIHSAYFNGAKVWADLTVCSTSNVLPSPKCNFPGCADQR